MKNLIRVLFFVIYLGFTLSVKAQFSKSVSQDDSLAGFDLNSIYQQAVFRGITAEEMPYYVNACKRGFINEKYKINRDHFSSQFYNGLSKIATAYCLNEDFENSVPTATAFPKIDTIKTSGGIAGWTALSGINSATVGSCLLASSCCTSNPNALVVIGHDSTGYIDPGIGSAYPIYSVFGDSINKGTGYNAFTCRGKYFIKLNNNIPNGGINQVVKTFTVTPSNSLFTFAALVVAQGGHCCCDGNGISVKLRDCSGNLLPTPQFSMVPSQQSSSVCPGYIPCTSMTGSVTFNPAVASGWVRTKWNVAAVNLTPYIGTCITIEANTFDCPYYGHAGYGYFDSQCDSMYILNNSQRLSAVSNTITINSCAALTDTLMAPMGLGPYIWTGPPGFTTANTQSITTNIPGTYTLSMNGFSSYAPTFKYIVLSHAATNIPVTSANTIICQGDSTILNATGATSFTWSTGANSNSITVTPSVTTSYTVNGVNDKGCPAKGVYTQSVSVCTGVNATTEYLNDFSIQPNPNNGEFIILKKEERNLTMEVYNTFGQMILSRNLSEYKTAVNISEYSNGIYFIKLFRNSKLLFVTKIVKAGS